MSDIKEQFDNETTYLRDPLYQQAIQLMADGNDAAAADALKRLADLHPQEKAIEDLLLRVQLRTAFGSSDYIRIEHTPPRPVLRNVVMLMLAVTLCLVVVTGFTVIKSRYYDPIVLAEQREEYIQGRWEEGERRLKAGDYVGARPIFEELAAELPDDPRVQEALQIIDQRKEWEDRFAQAIAFREQGDWQAALDLLYQIPAESPRHEDAQRFIQELQELVALEAAWQDAEGLVQAEDWDGAISSLEWIRAQNGEFRRSDVEERLYQLYVARAQPLVSEACGNLDRLRQAIEYMRGALTLRPANREWVEEERLAVGYVAGSEAYDRGDWAAAVARWEPVYAARPGYQCGVLKRRLDDVYPRAARQLISDAGGSVRLLSQAVDYMEKVAASQPDNPEWQEEQRLATEYLAGLEAFSQESWNLAVDRWGPIYAVRPDYQNGVLEENLRLACANSTQPDETLCPQ